MLKLLLTYTFVFLALFLSAKKDSSDVNSKLVIPVAYYTPETKFSAGLGLMQVFKIKAKAFENNQTHSSFLKAKALIAQTGQYNLESSLTMFTPGNRYFFEEDFEFSFVPLPFYGTGNLVNPSVFEYYSANILTQNAKCIKNIDGKWYIGLQQQYKDFELKEILDGGIIQSGIVGSEGGVTSGLGWVIRRDTRDNVNASYKGAYLNIEWIRYDKILRSDFEFTNLRLDYRKFISLNSLIIAWQVRTDFNEGVVPFYKSAMLGGDQFMRGYFRGQYRDHHFWMTQIELRKMFNPYLTLAGFIATGNVFNQINDWQWNYQKWSAGGGVRLTPPGTDRLCIRLDLSYGNQFYWYFTIGEAF